LQLAFETKRLRDIRENEERAAEELGTKVAEQLKRRLADLRAAESIDEMPNVVKPRKGSTKCRVRFATDRSIVFCANHNPNPASQSGTINWSAVRRIRILEIG
jgi:hypothetical protein